MEYLFYICGASFILGMFIGMIEGRLDEWAKTIAEKVISAIYEAKVLKARRLKKQ